MPLAAAAGIAAIGTIGGAAIGAGAQKSAAKTAANAQLQAANSNNALQREIYDRNTANTQPFMSRGNVAGNTINAFLGLGDQEAETRANNAFQSYIRNSDWDFQRMQGERGLGARLSASGGLESGAAQKALATFNSNLNNGYRNQFISQLFNQQGVGLSGANALAGVGTNYANAVNANNANAADAISNSALIRGNATSNLYASAGNALGNFAGQAFGSSFSGGTWNPAKDQWV